MRNSLTVLLLLAGLGASASGELIPTGARFAGMGYSGLTLTDVWSMRMNPAGLAGLERPTAGLYYQSHFLSNDLAQQGLAVAIPLGKGTVGLAADRFGYSLYNESTISACYAMRFGETLRASVQFDYLSVRLGGTTAAAARSWPKWACRRTLPKSCGSARTCTTPARPTWAGRMMSSCPPCCAPGWATPSAASC
ncbi:MAG: hypothetical protein R2818_15150 [Flavobacteriales bacterium]